MELDLGFLLYIKKKCPNTCKLLKKYPLGIYSSGLSLDSSVLYHFFDSHGIYGFVYIDVDRRWRWEIKELDDNDKIKTHRVSGKWWDAIARTAAELDLFENLFKTLEKR